MQLQMALEDACAAAARPCHVLVCHRGTLDPLAYWLRQGWSEREFFAYVGICRADLYRRYIGVIHLQTAAIDAETYYRRLPEAHRPETVAQAAEIDRLCAQVWSGHPRYVLIENANRDWPVKMWAAREVMHRWLASTGER